MADLLAPLTRDLTVGEPLHGRQGVHRVPEPSDVVGVAEIKLAQAARVEDVYPP